MAEGSGGGSTATAPAPEAPPAPPRPQQPDGWSGREDAPATAARTRRRRRRVAASQRWSLRRWLRLAVALVGLLALASIVLGTLALDAGADARRHVVERVDPAVREALTLNAALVDQESGVRGFALTGSEEFLEPADEGVRQQERSEAVLRGSVDAGSPAATALDRVGDAARAWRSGYADPRVERIRAGGPEDPDDPAVQALTAEGKALFDAVRVELDGLDAALAEEQRVGRAELAAAARNVRVVGAGLAAGLVLVALGLAASLRAAAISPLVRLGAETRRVADGDFQHEVTVVGPREVAELADDVDWMRQRILHELAELQRALDALDERSLDLQRSNAELEQFAYIASHDLQEPLRKVASFCQLLQRRYGGQLDERADQYIEFAVDGAKRMQVLINDLLAFSRVGRIDRERVAVDCDALLAQARANLATAIEESGAEITSDDLPTVLAEVPLLTAVFQNLLGNAIKFRGDEPPRVHVGVRRDGQLWEFSVADNGIGIEPEYAERVFVIFQRLHAKNAYPGTGIGLAMCRKIIEHHGGTIWLDTSAGPPGSTFRFTLPVLAEPDAEPADPPATAAPEGHSDRSD